MHPRTPLLGILAASACAFAQPVTIQEATGWFESAMVTWRISQNHDAYNVYVSGSGVADQKLDPQLVRSYGSYWRADALGLKAGTYTLKVVPVVGGKELAGATSKEVVVSAHNRAGFAFSGGRVPGAYNLDGTPQSGAVVVYVSNQSKDTVSLNVTGASANPCVGIQNILYGFKKGKDSRPLIVRLIGQVMDPAVMDGGDLVIENANLASGHITVEGVGADAVADGWGIRLKNASNIEVRNLAVMNVNSTAGDNVGLQQGNDHVWIHHIDHYYGDAGSDADQVKGDGAMDVKKSTNVTISYSHFRDNGKSSLLGLSEGTTTGLYIDYHHNWFDHSDSRHPRVRYYSAHVWNNYYDGVTKYGAGSTLGSSLFMEANYFRHCKYPMLTSMQGSDVWNETAKANDYKNMGTFSSEDGGTIKAWNNVMEGHKRFVPYGSADFANSTVDFDAYVAKSRSEKVPPTVKSAYGANTHNNFDTDPSVMHAYTPDSPEQARADAVSFAGRMGGGDLPWTFQNAVDDTSYAVNTALKTAVVGYKTSLVYVQGEGRMPISGVGDCPRSHGARTGLLVDGNRLVLADGTAMETVQVLAEDGRSVRSARDAARLDLAGLVPGVYVARARSRTGIIQRTVVVGN
ncbi:MAG TPA: pectate lyase [Fibrobacteria bacterium]|nr:pectate lyase [Fibrobacteria bacterium]